MPKSYSDQVTMRNITLKCNTFFDVEGSDQYELTNFTFENMDIEAEKGDVDKSLIRNFQLKNVKVNGKLIK